MIGCPHRALTTPPAQRNVPRGSFLSAQPSVLVRAAGIARRTTATSEPHAETKGEHCAGQAEPGGEQGHELRVAQADAFAAANEPVDPADEEDEEGGGEDRQYSLPGLFGIFPGRGGHVQCPSDLFSLEKPPYESQCGAWQGHGIREPEVLRVEDGQAHQYPRKKHHSGGKFERKEGVIRTPRDNCPQRSHGQFDQRIAPAD